MQTKEQRAAHWERVLALRATIGDPIEALNGWREKNFPSGFHLPDDVDFVDWCHDY